MTNFPIKISKEEIYNFCERFGELKMIHFNADNFKGTITAEY